MNIYKHITYIKNKNFIRQQSWLSSLLLLLALICTLLFFSFFDYPANLIYRCYALAFWHHADPFLQTRMCKLLMIQPGAHSIPPEYPLLSLLPFSIPLVFPIYLQAYNGEMLVLVLFLFWFIQKTAGWRHAWVYILFLTLGSASLVLNRFDLIPGGLLLLTLHYTFRKKYTLAYLFLAFATLFKIFPVILLIPVFIAQQHNLERKTTWFIRMKGIFIFMTVIMIVTGISFLINPQNTITPLLYFTTRPFQIEAFPSSILWIMNLFKITKMCIGYSFGSFNYYLGIQGVCKHIPTIHPPILISVLSVIFFLSFISLTLLCYYCMLRKILRVEQVFIAILIILLLTAKVFSPQYLLWISPVLGYLYGKNRIVITFWIWICLMTTIIYPFLYKVPLTEVLYFIICIRNFSLFAFLIIYIYLCLLENKKTSSL